MGLHFVLETYAFYKNPPLPVVVRLSWDFHPNDHYFFNLSIERLPSSDVSSTDEPLYDSYIDRNLAAPQHLYYLKLFKKFQIYIPFEIYKNLENYSICSENGLARWQEVKRYPTDISMMAVQRYPHSDGVEAYYKYFEHFVTQNPVDITEIVMAQCSELNEFEDIASLILSYGPPLTESDDLKYENPVSSDSDDTTDSAEISHPSLTVLPRKNKSNTPSTDIFSRWKEIFFRLNEVLKKSYINDKNVQETAFIFMASLFMNNGNYSKSEKERFHFPSNPLEDKHNEYLRSNQETPIFEKAKKILQLDKNTLFISLDAPQLQATLLNYYEIRSCAMTDASHLGIDLPQEPSALKIILLTKNKHGYTKEQIENFYGELALSKSESIETIKLHYVVCYVKEFFGVYALCFPGAHKHHIEQLTLVTSLGYGVNLIKFYKALFHWYDTDCKKGKSAANKETVFYQLWSKLYSDLNKQKPAPKKAPKDDVLQNALDIMLTAEREGDLYWDYIKRVCGGLKIPQVFQDGSTRNALDTFILQELYHSLTSVSSAQSLDDKVIEFQIFLDAVLLFLNHRSINIPFYRPVKKIFSDSSITAPRQIHICNYGMTAFSNVLEAYLSCFTVQEINVFNQVYFELLENLHGLNQQNIRYCKYTNDIGQQADLIFIDPHPNNAVEAELYSHQIQQILERCYPGYQGRLDPQSFGISYYSRKLTLVIDVTLNILLDDELEDLLNTVQPLIDAGLVNLVLIQSLTKFYQLGADKLSAGAIHVFNNNAWSEFNQKLAVSCESTRVDPLTESYFSLFCLTNDLLLQYRKKIAENTNFFHKNTRAQLSHLVFGQNFLPMELTESTDNHSCYLSFNYRHLIGKAQQKYFFTDRDVTIFNRKIIDMIVELSDIIQVPLTQRQSIGFPTSNINECNFVIRLVIGLESQEQLLRLSNLFVYVCYAFSYGDTLLKRESELTNYINQIKNIFITCFLNQGASDIHLGSLVIRNKIPKLEPRTTPGVISIKMHYEEVEVICRLSATDGSLHAQCGTDHFPLLAGQIDANGSTNIVKSSELPYLTRALLSLFVINHRLSNCELARFDEKVGIVVVNFVDIFNSMKRSFFYPTKSFGLLQFVFENNKLLILDNGHQILNGAQIVIHRSVLENFGIVFTEAVSPYIPFDRLPEEQKRQCFVNLERTRITFENSPDIRFRKNLPVRMNINAFRGNSENGFILEQHIRRGRFLSSINLFAIKHPVLNLYCQCVCLIAMHNNVSDIELDTTNHSILFSLGIQEAQLISRTQKIILFFIKMNHKIMGLFKEHNDPMSIVLEIIKLIPDVSQPSEGDIQTFLAKVFLFTRTNTNENSASNGHSDFRLFANSASLGAQPPLSDTRLVDTESRDGKIISTVYWYEDAEMHRILEFAIAQLNIPDIYVLGPFDNMSLYGLRDALHQHNKKAGLILVPFNLGQLHWVGLSIRYDVFEQLIHANYYDPQGSSTPEFLNNILAELQHGVTIFEAITDERLIRQNNGSDCGPCTISNLLSAAGSAEPASTDAVGRRLLHLQYLEIAGDSYFYENFYNRQQQNCSSFKNLTKAANINELDEYVGNCSLEEQKELLNLALMLLNLSDKILIDVKKAINPVEISQPETEHRDQIQRLRRSLEPYLGIPNLMAVIRKFFYYSESMYSLDEAPLCLDYNQIILLRIFLSIPKSEIGRILEYVKQTEINALKHGISHNKGAHPGFFNRGYNSLVAQHRHENDIIQHAYDQIYGLIPYGGK